jgi:hypothetical protein
MIATEIHRSSRGARVICSNSRSGPYTAYCAKGRAHARRLYEDAGRDVLGIYSAFEKWGTATVKDADFLALFSSAKQELSSRAAADCMLESGPRLVGGSQDSHGGGVRKLRQHLVAEPKMLYDAGLSCRFINFLEVAV